MIVVIEEGVFSSACTDLLTLLGLFNLGFRGQHRIQTDPLWQSVDDQAIRRWIARQDSRAREEIELVLADGIESDTLGIPAELAVHVVDDSNSDWDSLRLSPDDALMFLKRPLHILVENRKNDGAFLRMVAPEPWRSQLQNALGLNHIEIEHGGGSTMQDRIDEAQGQPRDALRLWALFDSDAREPGVSSRTAVKLSHDCHRARVGYHCLRRRESENYLPLPALDAWVAVSPANRKTVRRRMFRAFAQMSSEQRHHYNMRDGFERDRRSGIPHFLEEWAEHRDLRSGFGGDIRSIFRQEKFNVLENWLLKDGQQEEMLEMIQSILRRL